LAWDKNCCIRGPAGAAGAPGNDGAVGPQGLAGANGVAGAPGPAGPTAVSRDSANATRLGSDGLIYTPVGTAGGDFVQRSGDRMTGALLINAGVAAKNLTTQGDLLIAGVTVGKGASSGNTIVGANALLSLSSGTNNTAIGSEALATNTIGADNTAVGCKALWKNQASQLCAFGTMALGSNSTGLSNTGIGFMALSSNQTANWNTAIGCNALKSNVGDGNTVVGNIALEKNSSGSSNNAFGNKALCINQTGKGNCAFGENALNQNISGDYNVAIGHYAASSCTGSNNIVIGGYPNAAYWLSNESNCIVMGGINATKAYIKVPWTVVSDVRDKTNLAPVPYGLDFVIALKPIKYQYTTSRDEDQADGPVRYGFKAQDILALEGSTGVIIDNTNPDQLYYNSESLVPVLVNAIQELTVLVKELQSEVAALKAA